MVRWLRWHCPPDQDSKFEPWRSEAEHATSRSRRFPTILTFTRGWGRNMFGFFQTAETGNRTPNAGVKGSDVNHHPRAPPPPHFFFHLLWSIVVAYPRADRISRINVCLPLVHRLRRWTNVEPTLIWRLVSTGSTTNHTQSAILL